MPGGADTYWSVQVVWNDGDKDSVIVSSEDLGGLDWETWINNFLVKATRPHWARLGELVFYTQNVRSIALMETFEKED